jgi:adenylate kinase
MLSNRIILFLGAPGSGKGTQSSWLARQLGLRCLSTGDMLRAASKENTREGLNLRKVLASGSLVSDQIVCDAVGSRLRSGVAEYGLILDGFPRTVHQAECLDRMVAGMGMPRPVVLHLDVSPALIVERLTARRQCENCGAIYNLLSKPSARGKYCENDGGTLVQRDDDTKAVISRRLREFEASCAPLIDYYRGSDYHRIDGDRDPDAVSAELLAIASPVESFIAA